MDAIEAAQVLSEIGYLLRQDPKERFRAKAFSAAAWSLALQRPNLVDLQRAENLTSIEGVGEGICAARAQEKREVNPVDQRIRQARFHDSLMV